MDAVLRIQVKVAAREAQKALNSITLGVRSLQREMSKGGSASGSTPQAAMVSGLRASAKEIERINNSLARGAGVAGASKWTPAIGAKKLADEAKKVEAINKTSLARKKAMDAEDARRAKAAAKVIDDISKERVRSLQRAEKEASRAKAVQQTQVSRSGLRGVKLQMVMRGEDQDTGFRSIRRQMTMRKAAAAEAEKLAKQVAAAEAKAAKDAAAAGLNGIRLQMKMRDAAAKKAEKQTKDLAASQEKAAREQLRPYAKINRSLGAAQSEKPWQAGTGKSEPWNPGITAKREQEARKAIAAIDKRMDAEARAADKAARAQLTAAARKHNAEMSAIEKQRVADAKDSALAEAQVRKNQTAWMKGVWKNQVQDAQEASKKLNWAQKLQLKLNGPSAVQSKGLIAFGKDLQWVGRQLNFNFTIPMLTAGAAVFKWAMENERAMTRLKKVYGDDPTADYTKELDGVADGLRMLSDLYGVNQKEVIQLGAEWAAAGLKGGDLLKAVQNSLDLSILGDYENAADTFQDLIVIQRAFKLQSDEVSGALADLNVVENITAASLPDLVKAIALAGSTADVAGVSLQQLAGYTAALVPASGSAARAGNAVKTILTNIMEPTDQVIDSLRQIGIEFYSASFQALNGAQRLELIATKWGTLNSAQKSFIASSIAGRYQANRFSTLMEDLSSNAGEYAKVMESLDPKNAAKNLERARKEIETLLQSDPRKIQIISTQMKNMAVDAIIPMIPAITMLLGLFKSLLDWFNNLSPATKKTIVTFGVLIISVGLLSQMFGSLILLAGQLLRPIAFLGIQFAKLAAQSVATGAAGAAGGTAFWSAWALPVAAVIAAIAVVLANMYIYRDKLRAIWRGIGENIAKVLGFLPGLLGSVLGQLGKMLGDFAKQFGDFLQVFIPGQGVQDKPEVPKIGDLADADKAATTAANRARPKPILGSGAGIGTDAGVKIGSTLKPPSVEFDLAGYERAITNIKDEMKSLEPFVKAQEAVVKEAERAYNAAARAADDFNKSLDPLRKTIDTLTEKIADANAKIGDLAQRPISGMKAMNDAIFENEMAQKRLRLEILRMNEAGKSYDKIERRISELNGDIEMVKGKIEGLRQAGAGSDILNVYNKELSALEVQRDALIVQSEVIKDFEDQLESLQNQGEILDLEKSLKFDELLRQIDDLAFGMEELPYDEIVAGIKEQQTALAELQPKLEDANLELAAQEIILADLRAQSDILQLAYDSQREKLDLLNEAYTVMEEKLRDAEDAVRDFKEAWGIDDLGGGDWDKTAVLGFDVDETSLDVALADIQAQLDQQFKDIDPFKEVRSQWESLKNTIKDGLLFALSPPLYVATKLWENYGRSIWESLTSGFGSDSVQVNIATAVTKAVGTASTGAVGKPFGKNTSSGISAAGKLKGLDKFHSGGVIPGRREIDATVLGGEMVLTAQQQSRLFAIANGSMKGDTNNSSSHTVNINGDLSFPNITSGDDAEKLISNLEMLATV